jgi:hypothetical protein
MTKERDNERHKLWFKNKYQNDMEFREKHKQRMKESREQIKGGKCEIHDNCEFKTKNRCGLCNKRVCGECSNAITLETCMAVVCDNCVRYIKQ